MLANSPYRTTIRMGAAHYDLSVRGPDGPPLCFELKAAKREDKRSLAVTLCDLYGIEGTRPGMEAPKHKRRNRHRGRPETATTTQSKPKRSKHHVHANGTPGQCNSDQPVREVEATAAQPKPRRRRRKPRTVSTSGQDA